MSRNMNDESARRISETEAALRLAAERSGFVITADGRVSEADAAGLIGFAHPTLKAMRNVFGTGPPWFRAPVGSARISYRLHDLASWLESKRED